jgi:hypothetical protein
LLDNLHFRLEAAFDIVERRRRRLFGPSLSRLHVDEVDDSTLYLLIGGDPDPRLLAGPAAHVAVFGGDDLLHRHLAAINDGPFDAAAAGNQRDLIGLCRQAHHCRGDNRYSRVGKQGFARLAQRRASS